MASLSDTLDKMSISPWHRCFASIALPLLFACAGPGAKTPPPAEPYQRVLVYTAGEWPGAAEVADRVARVARVPVRDALQLAPHRYRMLLICPDHDACRAAMARVAADRTFALGIDAEGRVQIPAKPSRDSAR
jgi:hypothetical protein